MADKFINLTQGLATIKTWVVSKIAAIANPNESVTFNSSGQLDVGGRLGAFSGTTGIFHAKDREPLSVGNLSFLITDHKGMQFAGSRNLGLLTGNNITLTGSHAAGSTEYNVANTYINRLMCVGIKYVALNNTTASNQGIEPVSSVTINGQTFTPDSSADSTTPIVIKVENSVNPDSVTSSLRAVSAVSSSPYSSAFIGQCVGANGGGGNLVMGQNMFTRTGNMVAMVGQAIYNSGNGNSLFGRHHISMKHRWFMAGTGHDNTNGRSEAGAAVGQYSLIDANTLFAVGDGTSHIARKNAFEVLADGIVLPSPDGNRWKISVDNNGNITTTAL